ncbi:unnamed protein product, partial [Soboliphyme baturini]|uniref:BZIP domain-containing protein n=1 Tax=Soboliphyme baturini TaxID=241478 RepID=A0A183J9P2_9BILA
VIEIDETPQALRTKRRNLEAQERAAKKAAKDEHKKSKRTERLEQVEVKKSKVATETIVETESVPTKRPVPETPDYAAQLFNDSLTNYGLYKDNSFTTNMTATATVTKVVTTSSSPSSETEPVTTSLQTSDDSSSRNDTTPLMSSLSCSQETSPSCTATTSHAWPHATTSVITSGLAQTTKLNILPSFASRSSTIKLTTSATGSGTSLSFSNQSAPRLVLQSLLKSSSETPLSISVLAANRLLTLSFRDEPAKVVSNSTVASNTKSDSSQNLDRSRKPVYCISVSSFSQIYSDVLFCMIFWHC